MRSRRSLIGMAAVALAVSFSGTLGTAQAVQPSPAAPGGDLVNLIEFRTTSGGDAYFYTTNAAEASSAASKYGFVRNNGSGVICKLHSGGGANRNEVHRLRLLNGGPSYMLSISSSEWSDGRFKDEGVIGYTDGYDTGGKAALLRFSNNSKWRAFPDHAPSVQTMKGQGWSVDGKLGWCSP